MCLARLWATGLPASASGPLIVITQQNRRVHRHRAKDCEQAMQRATHPCVLDAQETTLPKRLSLKQKLDVDLRSSLPVAQSDSEKPKRSRFS